MNPSIILVLSLVEPLSSNSGATVAAACVRQGATLGLLIAAL